MCLLIVKPAGPKLERDWLMQGAKGNPHGSGAVWTSRKGMHYARGLYQDESFADFALKEVGEKAGMVHFRFSTHGVISKENCHPFELINGWFMAHNGIINGLDHPTQSDSSLYAQIIIARLTLDPDYLDRPDSEYHMATEIGASKLGFLHESGRYKIVNEDLGEWVDGVWFSNSGWKPRWAEYDLAYDWPEYRPAKAGVECAECYAPLMLDAVMGECGEPICRDCAAWEQAMID